MARVGGWVLTSLTILTACAPSLIRAVRAGKTDEVKALLEDGANPNVRSASGTTPLIWAANEGRADLVALLLKSGADANASGGLGDWTPLMWAAYSGHAQAAKTLVEYGADPLAKNAVGRRTAADLVPIGDAGLADYLRAAMRTSQLQSRLAMAAQAGDAGEIKRLLDSGAQADAGDLMGRTPLMAAAQDGRFEVVKILVQNGGDPAARDVQGYTAADLARKRGHQRIADYLEQAAAAASAKNEIQAEVSQAVAQALAGKSRAETSSGAVGSPLDNPDFPPESRRPDDFALIIGVESYQDQNLPRAQFARDDAETIARYVAALGVPKDNIILLEGARATSGRIRGYLESWLPKNVQPDSRVYFYFSGHGAPEPESGEAYLVPWDGDPEFLDHTAVPLNEVYSDLGRLKADRILMALDTCFSGSGDRSVIALGMRPLVTVKEDGAVPPDLTILAATRSDETASSIPSDGHGLFTYYLLKGLDSGLRDSDDVCRYLEPEVRRAAARLNRVQIPLCRGPDFRFR